MAVHVVTPGTSAVYRGLDNPLVVTADVPADQLVVRGLGCTVTGAAGQYTLRPELVDECTVEVAGRSGNRVGRATPVRLPVRRVPDPTILVANIKADGALTRGELTSVRGIRAVLEDFPLPAAFTVDSFVLSMVVNGVYVDHKASGPALTPAMTTLLAGARPGARVLVEQVVVTGPDGAARKVPGVVLRVV